MKIRLVNTGRPVGGDTMYRIEEYDGWFWGWHLVGAVWAKSLDEAQKNAVRELEVEKCTVVLKK